MKFLVSFVASQCKDNGSNVSQNVVCVCNVTHTSLFVVYLLLPSDSGAIHFTGKRPYKHTAVTLVHNRRLAVVFTLRSDLTTASATNSTIKPNLWRK